MLRRGEAFRNRAKRLLAEKKKLSAAWLQAASPITAEIMAKAGFDILMVDMEHGPGDIMNLISQMQAISHYEAVPFVRAPWNDFVTIKRILDAGVSGILVPYVNNAEEAARAVSACKYPLEGIRGIAPSPRAGGYGMNQRDYLDYANEELDVLVAVETKQRWTILRRSWVPMDWTVFSSAPWIWLLPLDISAIRGTGRCRRQSAGWKRLCPNPISSLQPWQEALSRPGNCMKKDIAW